MGRGALVAALTALALPAAVAQPCATANLTGGPRIPDNLQGKWIGPFDVPEFGVSGTTVLTLPNDSYVKFDPLVVYINGVRQDGIALPPTWDCVNAAAASVSIDHVTGQVNVSTTDASAAPLLQRQRAQCLSFLPVVVNGSVVALRSAQFNGSRCTGSVPNASAPLIDVVVYAPYTDASAAAAADVVRDGQSLGMVDSPIVAFAACTLSRPLRARAHHTCPRVPRRRPSSQATWTLALVVVAAAWRAVVA